MAEYDIGATIMFLNEEKFLPFSVRSFMESPAVKSIVLVEGCVQSQPRDRVSKLGLSTDGSSKIAVALAEESQKVEYVPVGFVESKKDLQNRGFHIIRARLGEGAIHMLAGADEVYHPHELVALQKQFKANPKAKQVVYPFYHFWWRPDLIATGSSWDVPMHRAYRRPGLPMLFGHHATPPADCGKGPKIHARHLNNYVCRCFHYVGMQDAPHIAAKLELYKSRDGHRLKVTDTWSHWEWGERTQWTHDGGSVRRFEERHPAVIEPQVWNLTPRDGEGKLLPLPKVPWDEDKIAHVVTPPKDIAVFVEGRTIPSDPYVTGLISYLQDHHKLTIYTLDGVLEDPGKYQVRKFKAHAINRHHAVILFPQSFVFRPLGAKHVAVLWKELDFQLDFTGYTVFRTPNVKSEYPEISAAAEFLREIAEAPTITTTSRRPKRPIARAEVLPKDGAIVAPRRGVSSETILVKIVNVTSLDWKRGTHYVGAFWATNKGKIRGDAPRTKADLPIGKVGKGETLICNVTVPRPPDDVENGFLQFCVDILDQTAGRWLGVGTRLPVQIRNWRVIR